MEVAPYPKDRMDKDADQTHFTGAIHIGIVDRDAGRGTCGRAINGRARVDPDRSGSDGGA